MRLHRGWWRDQPAAVGYAQRDGPGDREADAVREEVGKVELGREGGLDATASAAIVCSRSRRVVRLRCFPAVSGSRSRLSAHATAGCWTRPEVLVEVKPRRNQNRRPHPYHGSEVQHSRSGTENAGTSPQISSARPPLQHSHSSEQPTPGGGSQDLAQPERHAQARPVVHRVRTRAT